LEYSTSSQCFHTRLITGWEKWNTILTNDRDFLFYDMVLETSRSKAGIRDIALFDIGSMSSRVHQWAGWNRVETKGKFLNRRKQSQYI
jgi:hypothetical protein